MDRFQDFLNHLSPLIDLSLYAEKKRAVRIGVNEMLHVQLEDDEPKERILLATLIQEVPAGKYRENLFKECLKANLPYPRIGTFAYVERNNQLALFDYLYYAHLTPEKSADLLALFIEKALLWKQAIQKGVLPLISDSEIKLDHTAFGVR
ncbi:MAG: CesT family type III secretion system chaperone [Chlamydiales bacterium]